MIIINEYDQGQKDIWDEFVESAKNKHFFFHRDYLEYHSDRFIDNSLIFYYEDKLVALLPANLKENALISHGGLTYGGFICNNRMKTPLMLECFNSLKDYCNKKNIRQIIYKAIPHIYHLLPAEEDLYALFLNGAKLIRRDVSSTLGKNKIKYSDGRKWIIRKAKKNNIQFKVTTNFSSFWQLLSKVLKSKHNRKPVHSLSEMKKLASLFPNNIKLFISFNKHKLLAGTIIFENEKVCHTQYIATSDEGKKVGALDYLIDQLINNIYEDKEYFDFGISTVNDGKVLNEGLLFQKEDFGGRTVVYDTYRIEI
ncbi:GNAT family N-acetyltransferase [Candidatus Neomarinimicrobiota bacterium]